MRELGCLIIFIVTFLIIFKEKNVTLKNKLKLYIYSLFSTVMFYSLFSEDHRVAALFTTIWFIYTLYMAYINVVKKNFGGFKEIINYNNNKILYSKNTYVKSMYSILVFIYIPISFISCIGLIICMYLL